MGEFSITSAREAWRVLRGVACLYKPPEYSMNSLVFRVQRTLANDLNQLERSHETALQHQNDWEGIESSEVVSGDYSTHPLILGDGFEPRDISVDVINPITQRTSGVVLVAINNKKLCHIIRGLRMPRTLRVGMKLGEATDTSFVGGKVVEKSTYSHLIGKPQILDRLLSSVRASHQRGSFLTTSVDLQSQEAYELAAKGPVRPDKFGPTVIYGLKCIGYKVPNIELEVTLVNETEEYLSELVSELGLKLKTNAVCTHQRYIRYGYFTLDHSLLTKHINLENILNNIGSLKRQMKLNNDLMKRSQNIKTEIKQVSQF